MNRNICKLFIISLLLYPTIGKNKVEAGRVKIINESDLNLRVDVVSLPSGISYCKTCFGARSKASKKHTAEIQVSSEALGGRGYFSMVDATNGFLGGGSCNYLSVSKDYRVIFFETTLGTKCECKEI